MMPRRYSYVVISPVRNEAEYLPRSMASMLRQTTRPEQWILVNDGSTDGTAELLESWSRQYSWMTVVHRTNGRPEESPDENSGVRANRAIQAKEIEAFYEGFKMVERRDWEFLVKLDGDLEFGSDYFQRCLEHFDRDPTLGIGGGLLYDRVGEGLRIDPAPRFHVRGATKIYRKRCWDAIEGVVRGAGWDTLDEVKANMLGWRTYTFSDTAAIHLRFTGAANGAWRNAVKNGIWSYASGYHPAFVLARCVRSLAQEPILLRSLGILYGFILGYLRRLGTVEDKPLLDYLRAQQLRRLLLLPSIWH